MSVSNPKSKYVAYVSVLSQISSCQGLGRKNKHTILKTDHTAPLIIMMIIMITIMIIIMIMTIMIIMIIMIIIILIIITFI